jgi:hypothetical protein
MSAVNLEPAPVARPADPDRLNAFLGRMVAWRSARRPASRGCARW